MELLKNKNNNDKIFGATLLLLSLFILFPKNIDALFYYDDNPIRYMVAKRLVNGEVYQNENEFNSFLLFGSAEIYVPVIFIMKLLKLEKYNEIAYNISSLFYFVLSVFLLIFFLTKGRKVIQGSEEQGKFFPGFAYILSIFCVFGITSVVGGHVHWLLSSVFFLIVISKVVFLDNKKLRISDYILISFSHFLSPPLIIFSTIFSLLEKRVDIFFISLFSFLSKLPFGRDINVELVKTFLSENVVWYNFKFEDKLFLPLNFGVLVRILTFDYFRLSFIFAPLIYIVLLRSIYTRRKSLLFATFLYYSFVVLAAFILGLWEEGKELPKILPLFAVYVFAPNPTRFIPLFIALILFYTEKTKFDDYFKFIALFFFLVRALLSFFGFGPLPQKIPESVNSVIEYILNSTKREDKILVEGDKHIIENGKLIHPLYNSHIIPYIIAKVENRNFVGSGTPWEPFYSPFVAGKFKGMPIDKSEILSFISENDIKYVLCWTQECENFFRNLGKKIAIIDKFKIIHIQM